MVIKDLIDDVAARARLTKKDAEAAINSVFAGITEGLTTDGKVLISGFGIFEVKETKARRGVNPSNGDKINIPASKRVTFRVSSTLKDAIKGEK
ncbi:MAG TPA: DNA-binding protein [Firmicutes bacterium]|nr:DNA-binding protein [Bacillota bacterium]